MTEVTCSWDEYWLTVLRSSSAAEAARGATTKEPATKMDLIFILYGEFSVQSPLEYRAGFIIGVYMVRKPRCALEDFLLSALKFGVKE